MTPRRSSLVGTRRTVATADCTTDKAHVRDLMHLYSTWNITRKAKVILRYSVMCNESVLIICFNFDHGKYIYINCVFSNIFRENVLLARDLEKHCVWNAIIRYFLFIFFFTHKCS